MKLQLITGGANENIPAFISFLNNNANFIKKMLKKKNSSIKTIILFFFVLHAFVHAQINPVVFEKSIVEYDENRSFFPLNVGNQWQYYNKSGKVFFPPTYTSISNIQIVKDTLIDEKNYYKYGNILYRYDTTYNCLYWYSTYDSTEYLEMDFKLTADDTIQNDSSGWKITREGYEYLFNKHFYYKGIEGYSFSPIKQSTYDRYYAEGLGLIKSSFVSDHLGGGSSGSSILIGCKLVYKDSTIFYSNNYHPDITIKPSDTLQTFNFNIEFEVNHSYNHTSPPEEFFTYIDTVLFESYYGKEHSVITRTAEIVLNQPSTVIYKIDKDLDSVLLKQGYSFYYRIIAKDKGIVPHYSFYPDSGYHKAEYFKPTSVNGGKPVSSFSLFQNYPNPFNPATKIRFLINQASFVKLIVFDILGREITTLINDEKSAGEYNIEFDANRYGLSSGVYLMRMEIYKNSSLKFSGSRKISFMK